MKSLIVSIAGVLAVLALTGCGGTQPSSPDIAPEEMSIATPTNKVSVPVEVRFQLGGTPVRDQPVSVLLLFIPRVAGENLRIEYPPSASVSVEDGSTSLLKQKAEAAGVYRRNILVTPRTDDPGEMRVLVSMDVEQARYFGIFSVPLRAATR